MSIDVKYKTSATAQGGRDGRTSTEDGRMELYHEVLRHTICPSSKKATQSEGFVRTSRLVDYGRLNWENKLRTPSVLPGDATLGGIRLWFR